MHLQVRAKNVTKDANCINKSHVWLKSGLTSSFTRATHKQKLQIATIKTAFVKLTKLNKSRNIYNCLCIILFKN